MSKTLETKKVNKCIKKLNKQLQKDVFKDRFYCWQIKKSLKEGIEWFQFKLTDKKQPERNYITKWFSAFEICEFAKLYLEMNDFIIDSNFWSIYKNK